MKKIFLSFSVISAIILSSCGGETKEVTTENTEAIATEETCFYSYNETNGTKVSWTAFKTTAKKPVGGQFNQINVSAGEKSTKITDVLNTVKFNIPTNSTNTANEERDAKIINSFFGAMNATDLIIGHVKNAEGDNNSGTCTFYLTLNNVEREVTLNYSLEDATVKLTGEIDLLDFSAENAVTSLNEVCGDLHKGEDGISKTWSIVELNIETTLNKVCH
ncbi:MAG: YceI family protein [Vicingaceae bacterium]